MAIRMTLLTTERLFWHVWRSHFQVGIDLWRGRFLETIISCYIWRVAAHVQADTSRMSKLGDEAGEAGVSVDTDPGLSELKQTETGPLGFLRKRVS